MIIYPTCIHGCIKSGSEKNCIQYMYDINFVYDFMCHHRPLSFYYM